MNATKNIPANGTHPAKVVTLVETVDDCALASRWKVQTRWFKPGTDEVCYHVETFTNGSEALNWYNFA